MDNTLFKMKKLIILLLLFTNCASVPQERLASDNIFDALILMIIILKEIKL